MDTKIFDVKLEDVFQNGFFAMPNSLSAFLALIGTLTDSTDAAELIDAFERLNADNSAEFAPLA